MLWLFDLDVFVNFLVIIDLGVFFVLIAFLLNLTRLFQEYKTSPLALRNYSTKRVLFLTLIFILAVLTILMSATQSQFSNHSPFFEQLSGWTLGPALYDWTSIYNFVYFSDLQLMSDLYFRTNIFEFIVMNIFIYLGILVIITTLNAKDWLNTWSTLNDFNLGKFEKHLYMRSQNLQFQVKRSATVRVWSRSYYNIKTNDSATNLSTFNR